MEKYKNDDGEIVTIATPLELDATILAKAMHDSDYLIEVDADGTVRGIWIADDVNDWELVSSV